MVLVLVSRSIKKEKEKERERGVAMVAVLNSLSTKCYGKYP
jgi:hypothetical protein